MSYPLSLYCSFWEIVRVASHDLPRGVSRQENVCSDSKLWVRRPYAVHPSDCRCRESPRCHGRGTWRRSLTDRLSWVVAYFALKSQSATRSSRSGVDGVASTEGVFVDESAPVQSR